jgi:Domain of unknown function (DUF4394)
MRTILVLSFLGLTAAAAGVRADDDHKDRRRCGDGSFRRLEVVGLTSDQRLVCFDEHRPHRAYTIGEITGLASGDGKLVGIDFRPQDGFLYGLGDGGGIYTIDPNTAVATFSFQLGVTLDGTDFGFDFNPAADRLRIVSNTGQNLRVNVNAPPSTTVDGTLANPAPATPPALGVTGVAYTNNDLDANTGTTLYDVDTTLDQVSIQAPANNGSLNPAGKLLVDTNTAVGFDIYSRLEGNATTGVRALAALTTGGSSRLYRINLFTGRATLRGTFRPADQLVGLAIPLNQN